MSAIFQVCDVEELLSLMEQWGIAELHLKVGDGSIDLVREVAPQPSHTEETHVVHHLLPTPLSAAIVEEGAQEPVTIFAPVVGIFHLAKRGFPHRVPRPGDDVQAGQTIGSIELMRIPTDLVSPISGTIEAILADDGSGVEFGQPLMVIRPFNEVSEDEENLLQ